MIARSHDSERPMIHFIGRNSLRQGKCMPRSKTRPIEPDLEGEQRDCISELYNFHFLTSYYFTLTVACGMQDDGKQ